MNLESIKRFRAVIESCIDKRYDFKVEMPDLNPWFIEIDTKIKFKELRIYFWQMGSIDMVFGETHFITGHQRSFYNAMAGKENYEPLSVVDKLTQAEKDGVRKELLFDIEQILTFGETKSEYQAKRERMEELKDEFDHAKE